MLLVGQVLMEKLAVLIQAAAEVLVVMMFLYHLLKAQAEQEAQVLLL